MFPLNPQNVGINALEAYKANNANTIIYVYVANEYYQSLYSIS